MTTSHFSKARSRLANVLALGAAVGAIAMISGPALADWAPTFDRYDTYHVTDTRPLPDVPGREELRSFILSLKGGQPDYKGMTPELAASVMAELPDLQAKAQIWGGLKSLDRFSRTSKFQPGGADLFRTGYNGPPIYVATFEHGRVAFALAPLAHGKLTAMAYQEVS
jgi:hypothetical protein